MYIGGITSRSHYTGALTPSSPDELVIQRRDWSSAAVTSPSDRDVMTVAHTLQRIMLSGHVPMSLTSELGGAGGVTYGVTSQSVHDVRE